MKSLTWQEKASRQEISGSVNKKSNQKNLGTIRSSNLCTEIMEYTSKDEVAVCNLASISLSKFVDPVLKEYNFEKLYEVARVVTRNLNKVIDINYYPIPEAKNHNNSIKTFLKQSISQL